MSPVGGGWSPKRYTTVHSDWVPAGDPKGRHFTLFNLSTSREVPRFVHKLLTTMDGNERDFDSYIGVVKVRNSGSPPESDLPKIFETEVDVGSVCRQDFVGDVSERLCV